jgi:hypothetical protein
VTSEQFDALRVLRRTVKVSHMTATHFADLGIPDLRPAKALLEAHPSWRLFLNAVVDARQKATAALGMFTIVLKNQRMACGNLVVTTPSHTVVLRPRPFTRATAGDDDDDSNVNDNDIDNDHDDEDGN